MTCSERETNILELNPGRAAGVAKVIQLGGKAGEGDVSFKNVWMLLRQNFLKVLIRK